ncbi:MAG: hypothetical protein Q7J47_03340 [Azoarcus sp.]|nr:hypothetical protein [Azoarcus sp.]
MAALTVWQIETAFLARLAAHPGAPAGTLIHQAGTPADGTVPVLYRTLDAIDWTDPAAAPIVGGQLVFGGYLVQDQSPPATALAERWAFDVYIDLARATPAHRNALCALVVAAASCIPGWYPRPGLDARLVESEPTGIEPRAARISIAFVTPVILTGI